MSLRCPLLQILKPSNARSRIASGMSRTGAACSGSRRSSSPACCSPPIEDRRRPLLLRGVRGAGVRRQARCRRAGRAREGIRTLLGLKPQSLTRAAGEWAARSEEAADPPATILNERLAGFVTVKASQSARSTWSWHHLERARAVLPGADGLSGRGRSVRALCGDTR